MSPTTQRRRWIWAAAVTLIASALALTIQSRDLRDLDVDGRESYDAGVFTNFRLLITDTSALADAVDVWADPQHGNRAQAVLSRHLLIDALLFG